MRKEQGANPPFGERRPGRFWTVSLLLFLGLLIHRRVLGRGLLAHLVALLLPLRLLLVPVLLRVVSLLLLGLGGRGRRLGGREASRAESEGNAHHQRNDLLHVVSPPFPLSM